MIGVDVTIYCDALALLMEDKIDIDKTVQEEIMMDADYYSEYIIEEMCDYYDDFGELYDMSYLSFSDYITAKKEEVSFDYSETAASDNPRTIAFMVPCEFDDERFIEDLRKEYEENNIEHENDN